MSAMVRCKALVVKKLEKRAGLERFSMVGQKALMVKKRKLRAEPELSSMLGSWSNSQLS